MRQLFTIIYMSLRYLSSRLFASVISVLAVSVALIFIIAVSNINFSISKQAFDASIQYPLIVGADGKSAVQLILSAIFHIEKPSGTISSQLYDELKKDERVTAVFPIAAADSMGVYPIIGTESGYLKNGGIKFDGSIELSDIHDAVVGHEVSKKLLLNIGDTFAGSHGMIGGGEAEHGHESFSYVVKGILAPSDTPFDNAIYVNYKAVWSVHGGENGEEHEGEEKHGGKEKHEHAEDEKHEHETEHEKDKYNLSGGNFTALLIKTTNPIATAELNRELSLKPGITAADTRLTLRAVQKYFNKAGELALVFSWIILAISTSMILAVMLMSVNERKQELLLMRILGLRQRTIALILSIESVVISISGVIAGVFAGHLLLVVLNDFLFQTIKIRVDAWFVSNAEIWTIVTILVLFQIISVVAVAKTYFASSLAEEAKKG